MDITKNFTCTQNAISEGLIATTRASSSIATQDISFHRSIHPSIAASLDQKSRRLLKLTEKLLQRSAASSAAKVSLPNADAVESRWRSLVDATDGMFERTDMCLDEYSGLFQKQQDLESSQQTSVASMQMNSGRSKFVFRQQNLPKPQLNFEFRPLNHEHEPFAPLLTSKPHSKTCLAESCKQVKNYDGSLQSQHPYEDEIHSYDYPATVRLRQAPRVYIPFGSTKATFVDTEEALIEMVEELKNAEAIGVDLEHHDWRSYIGIVSLMQISTREHDWIVDTLKPWRRKLEILNEVFTDPSILKIFHGAHMDIIWLQRDFGLYVVGLFDTQAASQVLQYPGRGLAFLLKHFVDFDAQKQYQTADWRIRPLPPEMLDYARSDTHFLLYIYDCVRNELIDKGGEENRDYIADVLKLSKDISLQRYEHPFYDNTASLRHYGWASALSRSPGQLSPEQVAVYAAVHRFRDRVARDEDESVNYLMSQHTILAIAKSPPQNYQDFSKKYRTFPPLARVRGRELLTVIKRAMSEPTNSPESPQSLHAQFREALKLSSTFKTPSIKTSNQPTDQSLRLTDSQLWGGMHHSLLQTRQTTQNQEHQTHHLVLEPPHSLSNFERSFTAEATSIRTNDLSANISRPVVSDHATSTPRPVLRKRKNMCDIAGTTAENHNGDVEERAVQEIMRKAKRKANKTSRRLAPKEKQMAMADSNYKSHTSVISPEAIDHDEKALSRSEIYETATKPSVKPYARAAEASSGLKRAGIQAAGKSATFTR